MELIKNKSDQIKQSQLLLSVKTLILILATFMTIIILFANTTNWYLQKMWTASGDFWQQRWDDILRLGGHNEFYVGSVGTFIVTIAVFWIVGSIYTFIDCTKKPEFLFRYKIQPDAPYPIPKDKVKKVIKQVLFNQVVVGIPFIIVAQFLFKKRNYTWKEKLPSFQWILFELCVFIIIEEIFFYYTHRLFHHPRIYKYIHKRHHEFTAPFAIAAVYCHPIEHIVSNSIPIFMGPLLLGSHLAISWLWITIAILNTLNTHSGYHFPFFISSEDHDYHHFKFNQNFGVIGVLDTLHETNATFLKSEQYKRNTILFSLDPLHEVNCFLKAKKAE